jgi:cell division protein FtsL
MFNILLSTLIASFALTFFNYIDSNLMKDDNDLNKYLKYFIINFTVIFLTLYFFSLNNSIDDYIVNVDIPN